MNPRAPPPRYASFRCGDHDSLVGAGCCWRLLISGNRCHDRLELAAGVREIGAVGEAAERH